jgi:hypothetical protein
MRVKKNSVEKKKLILCGKGSDLLKYMVRVSIFSYAYKKNLIEKEELILCAL